MAMLLLASAAHGAPIRRVQGTIHEVGEGFIILSPDNGSKPLKLLLRWKAQFIPPKLPLPGDHVLVLYKKREEGLVVYGVNYLKLVPKGSEAEPDRKPQVRSQDFHTK
jgi:hypothetical protein